MATRSNFRLGYIAVDYVNVGSDTDISAYLGTYKVYPLISLENAVVTCASTIYNGSNQAAQSITVTLNGVTLTKNVDYSIIENAGGIVAGNYIVTVKGIGNYCDIKSGIFTINKADQLAPTAYGSSVAYGNTATATASGGGSQGSIEWSNGNTLTGNAGSSKTTKARWSGNSNYNPSSYSNEVTLSIVKADQSAPTATGATVAYHNTATATASGGGGQGTITWTNGNSRTSIGTTTTAAYWTGNSNYNASPNSNSVNLVVNKATDQSVTVTLTNRTYTGNSQVVASATSHGCTYYLGFGSSSTSAPTSWTNGSISQTNAGTYYIWYKGIVDENHSADIGATYKGTVTIGKASQSAPTAVGKTTTYPTTATATASGGGEQGTLTWTNGNNQTSVGSKKTKAYWAGNSNYNESPYSNEVTVQMDKATGSASVSGVSLTFNNSSRNLVTVSGNTGTMHYRVGTNGSWTTTIPTSTNVGSWTIYYYMDASTNYTARGSSSSPWGSVSSSIAKADQTAPTVTGATTTYPTTATASTSGGGGQGSIEWSNGNTQTSVGSKSTQARWSGNSNYNASSWSNSVTLTMNKASQNAPTANGATTTYPTTATATASGGGGKGSIEWSNGNTQTSVGSKTTKARWSGDSNYNASSWSNEVTVKMNKAAGSVTTAPVNNNYTYNGTARAVASAGSGTGTMYYRLGSSGNFSTTMPTMTNAGSNTLYYYAAASTNYEQSATGSITVTVQKASQNAPTATGSTTAYPTTATATASGGGGQGSIEWESAQSQTSIGSHTTRARWVGNANYNASSWSSYVTVQMNKANINPTVSMSNWTYGGTASNPSVSGNSGNGTVTYSYKPANGSTYSSTKPSDAGTYTVKAVIAETTNYNGATVTTNFTIAKDTPNLSWTKQPNNLVKGDTGTIVVYVIPSDTTVTYSSSDTNIASLNGRTITANNVGSCTITATCAETTNYKSASISYTLNVKIPLKIKINSGDISGVGSYATRIKVEWSWGVLSSWTVLFDEYINVQIGNSEFTTIGISKDMDGYGGVDVKITITDSNGNQHAADSDQYWILEDKEITFTLTS